MRRRAAARSASDNRRERSLRSKEPAAISSVILSGGTFLGVGLVVTELSKLPPSERIRRYRELAKEARREAAQSPKDECEAFLRLASAWERLADIAEHVFAARLSEAAETRTDEKLAAFKLPSPDTDES